MIRGETKTTGTTSHAVQKVMQLSRRLEGRRVPADKLVQRNETRIA